ncbi:MAG: biotin--[acetyl-CoA-carboxylase] ligase [Prevotella sp.]|jgi:BirA family biotin operon repressor/biotin-[acetyl-CoA-carboxylase] ligase
MLSIRYLFKKKKEKEDNGIRFVHLDETDSTNRYCLEDLDEASLGQGQPVRMVVVTTDYQSAGRGQGSNTWESERGRNLLFSICCHPTWIPVRMQFILSECIALAIRDALSAFTGDITIKWPNDIYYKDWKICGILIENRLSAGRIKDCVIGVGLNVNQREFHSDAPNPVSLCSIVGHEVDRQQLLGDIVRRFDEFLEMSRRGDYGAIAGAYASCLYRSDGFYPYKDREGTFEAAIVEVEDDGRLILRDRKGTIREYMFKEVEFVIAPSTSLRNDGAGQTDDDPQP